MTGVVPKLSRVRTVLFGGMVLVWFSETLFLGFPSLNKIWSDLWQVTAPVDDQLAAALHAIWATGAPSKAALFVMAVFGLLSKNASARTALFVSMALVPPLNIAFPFRQQGFLPGPMMVATTLSTILWVSFFVFREGFPKRQPMRTSGSALSPPSRWEIVQYAWFGVYSTILTLFAALLLFWPRTSLDLVLPSVSSLAGLDDEAVASLVHTSLASGTHMLAVSIGFWFGTLNCRRNATLRRALTAAGIAHSGLFFVFPLRQIAQGFGTDAALSSILVVFAPLFAGWLIYAAFSTREEFPFGSAQRSKL